MSADVEAVLRAENKRLRWELQNILVATTEARWTDRNGENVKRVAFSLTALSRMQQLVVVAPEPALEPGLRAAAQQLVDSADGNGSRVTVSYAAYTALVDALSNTRATVETVGLTVEQQRTMGKALRQSVVFVDAPEPALEPGLREELYRTRLALQGVVRHWNEFGPEYGFDERMDGAERTLRALASTPDSAAEGRP